MAIEVYSDKGVKGVYISASKVVKCLKLYTHYVENNNNIYKHNMSNLVTFH